MITKEQFEKYIIRFEIKDMAEELKLNLVAKSRHKEILKLYKDVLGEGPVYCISGGNEIGKKLICNNKCIIPVPDNMQYVFDKFLKKCFKFQNCSGYGFHGPLTFLNGCVIHINDIPVKCIKQSIEPMNAQEFYSLESYQAYYFLKEDIDKIYEQCYNV
jgi:hypothetical protein